MSTFAQSDPFGEDPVAKSSINTGLIYVGILNGIIIVSFLFCVLLKCIENYQDKKKARMEEIQTVVLLVETSQNEPHPVKDVKWKWIDTFKTLRKYSRIFAPSSAVQEKEEQNKQLLATP